MASWPTGIATITGLIAAGNLQNVTADDVAADAAVVRALHAMAENLVEALPVFVG